MSRLEIARDYYNSNPNIESRDFRIWFEETFRSSPHVARSAWSKVRGIGVRGTYEEGARSKMAS